MKYVFNLVIDEKETSQTAKKVLAGVIEKLKADHPEKEIEFKIKDASPVDGEAPAWAKDWYSFPRLVMRHDETPQLVLIDGECVREEYLLRCGKALLSS